MPDVYGPFSAATWGQGPWYRDAWARSSGGVYGAPYATSTAGDLGLTVVGLDATIALGRAHVRGAGYERTGTAWTVAVPANTNATNARIDRIVLRRDLTAGTVVLTHLQGTAAATPAAPALTQNDDGVWDLPLFSFTVPANSGTPLTAVVDERPSVYAPAFGTIRYANTSSSQAVGTATISTVLGGTGVTAELNDMTWLSAQSRLVVKTAGLYCASGVVAYSANATGRRFAHIFVNGVQHDAFAANDWPGGNTAHVPTGTGLIRFAVGDYLTLVGYQDSGSTLNFVRESCYLQAHRIAP